MPSNALLFPEVESTIEIITHEYRTHGNPGYRVPYGTYPKDVSVAVHGTGTWCRDDVAVVVPGADDASDAEGTVGTTWCLLRHCCYVSR